MPKKREVKKPSVRKSKKSKSFLFRAKKFFRQFLVASSFRTKALIIVGLFLVTIPTFFYINEGVQLAFFTPRVPVIAKQYAPPTWISIPTVDMELPIHETAISNGAWGIDANAVSHLNVSARPGEIGPIILYGHNTNDRFGPIRWLTEGKTIELLTSDGKRHGYTIVKIEEVDPSQVSVLLTQNGETLILYTCSGFADLKRFIVIAKPS